MFAAGELRLVLLKLIADEPRHGYELMKALEETDRRHLFAKPGHDLSDALAAVR